MMRKLSFSVIALTVVASILTACGCPGTPTPSAEPPTQAPAATTAPQPTTPPPTTPPQPPAEKVQIRWFVGLGTGSDPEQIPDQEALIAQFNAENDHIELVAEFVDNAQAPDVLSTEVAAGNAPDIVGPVGQSGVNEFSGLFLDLEPYLEAMNFDWSDFDEDSIDAYRLEGEGLLGIPFAVYPSFIFYNKELFDEAGLDYPPHEWGADYADGDPWDTAKLEELAMLLTVDANGNDANSPDFDPDNIVQFGYFTQWTLPRGEATALFGADSPVDENGDAAISERWREAWKWYFDAMHVKHFMPNQTYENSDLLAAGNVFDSGNNAMAHCHLWYTCCVENVTPNWDAAAVPSYGDGQLISKLHADTFRIFKSTEHPEEAVEVLVWMTGDGAGELLQIYGGFPGRTSLQEDFIAGLDEQFPQGVDWQVAIDGLMYPDIPNHEANMPNYSKAFDRMQAFMTLYHSDPTLDMDEVLDQLEADLQAIFEEVQ